MHRIACSPRVLTPILVSLLLLGASSGPLCAQEDLPEAELPPIVRQDEGERRLVLTEAGAVALALRNNLTLRGALLDELIEAERIREALGVFDPTLFASSNYGRRQSLFAANFPLDPANPFSPTVTRVISNTSDVADLVFGLRGTLETGMSYDLTFRSDYQFNNSGSGLNPIYNTSVSFNVTQPLLARAWSSYNEAPVEIARLGRQAARESYRARVRETIYEVQQAYYDLVFAIEDHAVKTQSRDLAARQVDLTRVRVETGALAPVEMTAAESGLAGREADLVSAEAAIVSARDRLRRRVLAFETPGDWELEIVPAERARPPSGTLVPLDEGLKLAEASEPELLRLHLATAQQRVRVRQAEGEIGPSLDIVGSGNVTGLADDPFQSFSDSLDRSRGALGWSLGLQFEMPLGDRTAKGRLAAEKLRLTRAEIDLKDRRTEVAFQVRRAYRDVDVARRSVTAREKAVRLSEEELENERTRLELGTSTNFDVFQVEDQLAQRRTELIRVQLDHRLALLDLARVSGVALEALLMPAEPAGVPAGDGR